MEKKNEECQSEESGASRELQVRKVESAKLLSASSLLPNIRK
jgi:hypothetical protein